MLWQLCYLLLSRPVLCCICQILYRNILVGLVSVQPCNSQIVARIELVWVSFAIINQCMFCGCLGVKWETRACLTIQLASSAAKRVLGLSHDWPIPLNSIQTFCPVLSWLKVLIHCCTLNRERGIGLLSSSAKLYIWTSRRPKS